MPRSQASGHSRKQSCRWQVCAGREQTVFKTETAVTCADDDSSTRKCCGIVWRLPQQPQSLSESARLAKGKYHCCPFGAVVSKCALTGEKRRETPGFPETSNSYLNLVFPAFAKDTPPAQAAQQPEPPAAPFPEPRPLE